ncbi:MAG: hypothetical protein N2422_13125, partial [Rhodobacteraceae bacterium]|nr:hypothetical protein [Paracoccaceae bacterium]
MTGHSGIDDEALLRLRHGGAGAAEALAALARGDPGVAARLAEWDRQDAALAALYAPVGEEPVPERLKAALAAAPAARPGLPPRLRIAAAAALLALGAAGGWLAAGLAPGGGDAMPFAAAALQAHATFAADVARPVEVAAADPGLAHWLSARIGHAIRLPDLGAEGFALLGGRVVPGAAGPAALVMYENAAGIRLSLVVGAAPQAGERPWSVTSAGGVTGVTWMDGGIVCT